MNNNITKTGSNWGGAVPRTTTEAFGFGPNNLLVATRPPESKTVKALVFIATAVASIGFVAVSIVLMTRAVA